MDQRYGNADECMIVVYCQSNAKNESFQTIFSQNFRTLFSCFVLKWTARTHPTQPQPPSPTKYWSLVGALATFALVGGYFAGIEPEGQWRYFSWHPFLMTCGMVGVAGISAITKKRGGYANTKMHGIMGWASIMLSFSGIYVIYQNKENNGYEHLKSLHAQVGLALIVTCVGLGMAGG